MWFKYTWTRLILPTVASQKASVCVSMKLVLHSPRVLLHPHSFFVSSCIWKQEMSKSICPLRGLNGLAVRILTNIQQVLSFNLS